MSYPTIGIPIVSADEMVPKVTVAQKDPQVASSTAKESLSRLQAHPVARRLPAGLARELAQAVADFPLRIVIVDNSGSMRTGDGERVIAIDSWEGWPAAQPGAKRMQRVTCTRWQELGQEVVQLATLATALNARTDFHLLNPAGGFDAMSIASPAYSSIQQLGPSVDVSSVEMAMRTSPCGTTPLTESVQRIITMINPHAQELRARGEHVAIVLCTDGIPNDRPSFLAAMQALQQLPVWVVVRLCTGDDAIVDYWNDLDRNLESPLEVLDDLKSEAVEVSRLNSWLTYGEPLHLCRLFGVPWKLCDSLDEVALLPLQIAEFIEGLLGVAIGHDPQIETAEFLRCVKEALASIPPVVNPMTLKARPWVDLERLEKALRSGTQHHCGSTQLTCALL